MIAGSLTIGATQASRFDLPFEQELTSGQHVAGRYSGSWQELVSVGRCCKIYLPHRDKEVSVTWDVSASEEADRTLKLKHLLEELSGLDSEYVGATQQQKYANLIMRHTEHVRHVQVALALNTKSTHSSFSLLSVGLPISLLGVYDPQLRGAYLVWATLPMEELVGAFRHRHMLRYIFYRFPEIVDSSVFIPTQATCAHWWKYSKNKDPLFSFNAMELKLFR